MYLGAGRVDLIKRTMAYTMRIAQVMSFAFPFVTIGVICGRAFQGLGHGIPSLILTSLRVVLISVPLAVVLTHFFDYGLTAVWVAFPLSAATSSLLALGWIRRRLRLVERAKGAVAEST